MTDLQLLEQAHAALLGIFECFEAGTVSFDHDDGCPEDDTCDCPCRLHGSQPASDALNAITARLKEAKVLPKCACTYEAGDSRCEVHPTCMECGIPLMRGYVLCAMHGGATPCPCALTKR